MALKKTQLYSSLWQSCDELRGGMDASQYKDYVLTLLFMKYVSDKYAGKKDAVIEVPRGGGFADMAKLKGDKEIGDKINKIIGKLAEANDLKGVINQADFNDEDKLGRGKEMQDRLSKLVGIFDGLDFRANRAEGDDLLGDAYEYLMRHFATESGKSKGQFYTPAEVSRIMAKVIGIERAASLKDPTAYDPTCGSGSLLIKAADESGASNLAIYGQEMDNATWALAKMNMILHGHPTADLWRGNTLAEPHFKNKDNSLKTFDFAVANPPFSSKAWSNGLNPAHDEFHRFDFGMPPIKNGDYAFLLHLVKSLKSKGKGAIILPHGVLFRGNREADIRRKLIEHGLIKGIIGLPPNLFYGTGIPACIIVIDKENAHARSGIFMIDASKGFIKDGNKNRLRAQDIHKIVDAFTRQLEIPRYSRMVPLTEIADPKNDFNLNLPRYIDSSEPEDIQDIEAHLRGGIPVRDIDALEHYWKVFPSVRDALFKKAKRAGYVELRAAAADIKATIFEHAEFTAWSAQTKKLFTKWRTHSAPRLRALAKGDKPKPLIEVLAEDLLATFQKAKLLDPYDVYQHLMDHWAEGMQDDVYLIVGEGWREAAKPQQIVDDKDKKSKVKPDFVLGKQKFKAELVPPALIIARYFAADQAAIEKLESQAAGVAQEIEELAEEHGAEDGLLAEAKNEKDKLTKASVAARLKAIKRDKHAADERKVLEQYLKLAEREAGISATIKAAQDELVAKVAAKYGKLSDDDIKTLVVDDKWLAAVEAAVQQELDRVSQTLTGRVRELAARYAVPLPKIVADVDALAGRVDEHLKKMGAVWQ
jgi:type I restriction enzyme M protein